MYLQVQYLFGILYSQETLIHLLTLYLHVYTCNSDHNISISGMINLANAAIINVGNDILLRFSSCGLKLQER